MIGKVCVLACGEEQFYRHGGFLRDILCILYVRKLIVMYYRARLSRSNFTSPVEAARFPAPCSFFAREYLLLKFQAGNPGDLRTAWRAQRFVLAARACKPVFHRFLFILLPFSFHCRIAARCGGYLACAPLVIACLPFSLTRSLP